MPLKIVKVEQLTRPTRQKQSVVTSLPEFVEATLKLSHGLKPQEGIEITLPKKDERGYKHIAFGMKKHISDSGEDRAHQGFILFEGFRSLRHVLADYCAELDEMTF